MTRNGTHIVLVRSLVFLAGAGRLFAHHLVHAAMSLESGSKSRAS